MPRTAEENAAHAHEYYRKNKGKITARNQEYRRKNKEKIAAYKREYRRKNKEKIAAHDRKKYLEKRDEILDETYNRLLNKPNKNEGDWGKFYEHTWCRNYEYFLHARTESGSDIKFEFDGVLVAGEVKYRFEQPGDICLLYTSPSPRD